MANTKESVDLGSSDSGLSPKSSAPLELLPAELKARSLEAFGHWLNPKAAGMVALGASAITFAQLAPKGKEVIIDRKAVIQSLFAYGAYTRGNAAYWVHEFISRGVATVPSALEPRWPVPTILAACQSGSRVALSQSMTTKVIPAALLIAKLTVGRDVFDLRHLVMALLHDRESPWLDSGINLSANGLHELRKSLAEQIAQDPERGERVTVWRQLAETPPEAIEQIDRTQRRGTAGQRKTAATKPSEPPLSLSNEGVPIQTDDPAVVDQLGRKGFATVLADRIIEARQRIESDGQSNSDEDDNRAFIVHMHGPWGSGKSTVLNFIRARLEQESRPWLVVEYNAWRSQRLAPPWWSLILAVQKAALRRSDIGFLEKRWLALRWHWMRAQADYVPMLKGLTLLLLAFGIVYWFVPLGAPPISAPSGEVAGTAMSAAAAGAGAANPALAENPVVLGSLGAAKDLFASIAAIGTAIAGIFAFGRSLLFGGGAAAKAYEGLQTDPYTPMMTLFCRLVRAIDRPIIVFVDDLDRCERDYVCELLENIQTMLRSAQITYLIAADRKWITTSFEKRYADFSQLSTDAGRPLGFQFLDKLFQVSATLPVIPPQLRVQFWNGLLHPAATASAPALSESDANAKAVTAVAGARTLEELQAAAKAESNPIVQQAIRAEGARKLAGEEVRSETEHRLQRFGALIEANPRAMKRLANAVGMNLARAQIEGRDEVSFEGVARWTIIELRWPLLADWLAENPNRISGLTDDIDPFGTSEELRKLLEHHKVKAVIGSARDKGRLTAKSLEGMIS